MFSLKGKIIVVTGGSGLIGREIIARLREAEAIVLCADIFFNSDEKDNVFLDITDEAKVIGAVEEIVLRYNRIDGWVNNAYPRTDDWGKKFEDFPFQSFRKNVDMHLNGYFLCCKVVLEQMKKQRNGSLINMTSIYGTVGPDFTIYEGTDMTNAVAYSAIKGGVISLSRYLASYFGPYQIRVNCISPGGIYDGQNEIFLKNYNRKVPLKRMGVTKDVAAAVHFLLSDDAGYITGHNLLVDGGWCIV